MHAFLLQDWTTIRGRSGVSSIVQGEQSWLELDGYQDIILWLQVAEVTQAGGTIVLNYETAPIRDEALFVAMGSTTISGPAISPPTLTKVILSTLPNQPLSRWVRWRLSQTFAGAAWDVTFRVAAAANCVSGREPAAGGEA